MKEGSVVPGINRVPNISLEESIKMEMEAMRLVMQVPGVKSAVSGVGRGESPVSYTHLRAHETVLDLVCRLLLEKKKKNKTTVMLRICKCKDTEQTPHNIQTEDD